MCRHLFPMAPMLVVVCHSISLLMISSFLLKNHPKIWDAFFEIAGEKRKYGLFDLVAQLRMLKFVLFSRMVPLPDHRRLNDMLFLFRAVSVVLLNLFFIALLLVTRQPVEEFCT